MKKSVLLMPLESIPAVPTVGHLPVCFQIFLIPGNQPGGGGTGWALGQLKGDAKVFMELNGD